jgi:hypothetical protein
MSKMAGASRGRWVDVDEDRIENSVLVSSRLRCDKKTSKPARSRRKRKVSTRRVPARVCDSMEAAENEPSVK